MKVGQFETEALKKVDEYIARTGLNAPQESVTQLREGYGEEPSRYCCACTRHCFSSFHVTYSGAPMALISGESRNAALARNSRALVAVREIPRAREVSRSDPWFD